MRAIKESIKRRSTPLPERKRKKGWDRAVFFLKLFCFFVVVGEEDFFFRFFFPHKEKKTNKKASQRKTVSSVSHVLAIIFLSCQKKLHSTHARIAESAHQSTMGTAYDIQPLSSVPLPRATAATSASASAVGGNALPSSSSSGRRADGRGPEEMRPIRA